MITMGDVIIGFCFKRMCHAVRNCAQKPFLAFETSYCKSYQRTSISVTSRGISVKHF